MKHHLLGYTRIVDTLVCDPRAVALKDTYGLKGFSHASVELIWRDYCRKYFKTEWEKPDVISVENAFGVILSGRCDD